MMKAVAAVIEVTKVIIALREANLGFKILLSNDFN